MPYREFHDSRAVLWRVWETRPHSAANVRPQFATGWLSFECEGERRRLRPVPAGWEKATDDELWEWLSTAEPVQRITLPAPRGPGEGDPAEETEETVASAAVEKTRSTIERIRGLLGSIGSGGPGK